MCAGSVSTISSIVEIVLCISSICYYPLWIVGFILLFADAESLIVCVVWFLESFVLKDMCIPEQDIQVYEIDCV